MALILPSPQTSDSRSTQHTKKNSTTSNHRSKNQVQNGSNKYNQDFDPQTPFRVIPRKWPTWPDIEALTQKAANIDNVTNAASNSYLTPMERWRIETQQQSPWNGVAAVITVRQERYWDFEGSPQDCSRFGDTDGGSWTSVFETV